MYEYYGGFKNYNEYFISVELVINAISLRLFVTCNYSEGQMQMAFYSLTLLVLFFQVHTFPSLYLNANDLVNAFFMWLNFF